MKKIDRYIMNNFVKFSLLGLMAFLIIFVLRDIFSVIGYIVEGKITGLQGLELLFAGIPDVFVQVIPLAILIGGLMSINKMASNLEIIALKTSGISFARIARYPIICSLILSIFIFWFNNKIVPLANKRRREIKHVEVFQVKDSRIKSEIFLKGEGNYLYYVRVANGTSQTLTNIQIVEFDGNMEHIKRIIISKRGVYDVKNKTWTLHRAVINDIESKTSQRKAFFKPKFMKESPDDFLRDRIREGELSIHELMESITFIRKTGGGVKKLLVALYKKIAYPFAGFIMSFIGLSLGSRYVRGASAVSIGLSVVLGYIYYILMVVAEALGAGGFLNPVLGSWIPNLIFLVVGIFTMQMAEH